MKSRTAFTSQRKQRSVCRALALWSSESKKQNASPVYVWQARMTSNWVELWILKRCCCRHEGDAAKRKFKPSHGWRNHKGHSADIHEEGCTLVKSIFDHANLSPPGHVVSQHHVHHRRNRTRRRVIPHLFMLEPCTDLKRATASSLSFCVPGMTIYLHDDIVAANCFDHTLARLSSRSQILAMPQCRDRVMTTMSDDARHT
eukprot:3827458-Amphidinium_carterae.1